MEAAMATLRQQHTFTNGSFGGIRWSRVERAANDPRTVRPTTTGRSRLVTRVIIRSQTARAS
jgi:hypothetical protein